MSGAVATPPPTEGHLDDISGTTLLTYDADGKGRVVEVFGSLATAEHVAIVVPGNAHHLGNYFVESAGASPRANGRRWLPHSPRWHRSSAAPSSSGSVTTAREAS